MRYLTVVPAYGRDYSNETGAVADWNAGKDFRIMDRSSTWDGRYTSVRDWTGTGVTVNIRYKRMTMIAPVKHPA
jgi:hypothetical protein